ncbi:hypothetical protein TWF718_007917 [Orbilia javanica]|uniref:Uncharacterized protein n=1 Tax=Orbilia javanica TaxID=47235 RepID=A0AAN8MRW6_9PEZI
MSANGVTFPTDLPLLQATEDSPKSGEGEIGTPPKPVPPLHTVFPTIELFLRKGPNSGPGQRISTTSSGTTDSSLGLNPTTEPNSIKPVETKEQAIEKMTVPPSSSDSSLPNFSANRSTLFKALNDPDRWTKEVPINANKGKTRLTTAFDFRKLGPDNSNDGAQQRKIDTVLQYLLKQTKLDNERVHDRYEFEHYKLQLQKEREERDAQQGDKQREYELERLRLEIQLETIRSARMAPPEDMTTEPGEKVASETGEKAPLGSQD